MNELDDGQKAFSNFRVLTSDADGGERDQLLRHMAQLFSFVSDRCDDEQVGQYDQVLCQLADMVQTEARADVAKLLAPLERAPGMVVAKLANDCIEVAAPLLEFSNVLSDDDLIEIATRHSEAHRMAIAGRAQVTDRVGQAIVAHGGKPSLGKLVRNPGAELGEETLGLLIERAAADPGIQQDLRGRNDIKWDLLRDRIQAAGGRFFSSLPTPEPGSEPAVVLGEVTSVVYNRMRNQAGFSAQDWKIAYNQVKALSDRKQLDERALTRFVRFGYGHHAAASLTVLLHVGPEVMVKWLASQDYVAVTVALRAMGIQPEVFSAIVATLPWRDLPSQADKDNIRRRFEAVTAEEALEIFELWRAHSFRKRSLAA